MQKEHPAAKKLRLKRKRFRKELETKPATTEELWFALLLIADDYTSASDPEEPGLDYVFAAREVLMSVDDPKTISFEEVQRRQRLLEE